MNAQIKSGLLTKDHAIPLEGVRVEVRVLGACLDVTVTQRYRNSESVPVEAVYVFPLEESAAVCGFEASISGVRVVGRVQEREQAFAEYDDAIMRGDGAFLLDQERPNVFTASIGNLKPNAEVQVRIRYVALATREGDAIRIAIPTTVSPRYVPDAPPQVGQPEGERVNPEHRATVPYGLSLAVDVGTAGLRRIESPSHPIRTSWDSAGARVELAQDDVALDRDFVLLLEHADPSLPQASVAREADGQRVAMISFLPRPAAAEGGHEVLFLLDCSASMQGTSITEAKRALALCVRALGPEDTFNVVRFGSDFKALWKTPRKFDDASLDEATKYITRTRADQGGTEILPPLAHVLEAERDAQRPRRVLILTDGQVANEDEVLALARQHAGSSRIFAFGIGAGASEHLVRGTARVSRGAAEMIFPGERIEPKVLRMFTRIRTAVLDDVRIDWKGLRVEAAPARVPPVFSGDMLTVFARIEGGTASAVELIAGDARLSVAVDLERAEAGGPIPVLWARELMREIEDAAQPRRGSAQERPEAERKNRHRLVELGTRYGLVSSATSFVAIEERSAGDQLQAPAELRRIPVALTTGWGGGPASSVMVGSPGILYTAVRPGGGIQRGMMMAAPSAAAPGDDPRGTEGFFARAKQALIGSARERSTSAAETLGSTPRGARARASEAPPDLLFDLLMTQRAEGSFETSAALEACLGSQRVPRLNAAVQAHASKVVITSVVIGLLEREYAARESEWRPAVTKAKAWLVAQDASFDAASVL